VRPLLRILPGARKLEMWKYTYQGFVRRASLRVGKGESGYKRCLTTWGESWACRCPQRFHRARGKSVRFFGRRLLLVDTSAAPVPPKPLRDTATFRKEIEMARRRRTTCAVVGMMAATSALATGPSAPRPGWTGYPQVGAREQVTCCHTTHENLKIKQGDFPCGGERGWVVSSL